MDLSASGMMNATFDDDLNSFTKEGQFSFISRQNPSTWSRKDWRDQKLKSPIGSKTRY